MNDLPRDEHLQAALRHAPDAQAVPPPHLSAQILAAAHRAAAEAPPQRRRRGFFGTPWRLGASGAFATVALAGVLGLLWRDERPGPASEAPAAVPAAAPVPAAPPRVDDAAQKRESAAREAAAREMAGRERARDAATARVQAEQRVVAERRAEMTSNPPASMPRPTPASVPAPLAQADAGPAASVVATAAAPPPPPPAPAPTAAPVAAAAARAAAPALRMAARPAAPWLAADTPLQWQLGGSPWKSDPAWLSALATLAQGRWQPAPDATPAPDELQLEWAGPAGMLGRLWLGERRLLSCDAAGRCEAAVLDAEAAAMLRRTLPR